jgi:hypothetical protein
MPSRTLTLVALLALTDIPSVLARVGDKNQSHSHSMLRRNNAELPLADAKFVKESHLEVVQIPKWNEIISNAIEVPSISHKDEN